LDRSFGALTRSAGKRPSLRAAGDKHPSGPSLKLLNLLERKGLEAVI